jgi:hypothetical protein
MHQLGGNPARSRFAPEFLMEENDLHYEIEQRRGLLLAKKLRKYANRKDVADFGVAARWSAGGV